VVLQRDRVLPVWGWGEPGERVVVEFGKEKGEAVAGDDGRWEVRLGAQPVSKVGQTMRVSGSSVVEVKDVLLGDVWMCSGQSNMDWGLGDAGCRRRFGRRICR
jgi:sialate O-acetylesterase